MKIHSSSSTTLLVLAAVLLGLGAMILSPDGRLLLFALAGLCALVILFFGPSLVRRMIALLILAVIVLQAMPAWDQYRVNMHHYRQHRSGRSEGQTVQQPQSRH